MIKKAILLLFVTLSSASGQSWFLDKSTSSVGFSIVHLKVSTVDGSFGVYDAKFTAAKKDFSDAVIEFSADVVSVNTSSKSRDNHLRKDEYFDAAKFPKLTFKSTSVKKAGSAYKITGNLTIKGVTKPVVLDATFKPAADAKGVEITASGEINRIDFGVGTSGASLNDEVKLKISGTFNKQYFNN
jgi:polyisoprenoid-binding protein YceI